ncbi:protein phosphatase 1 regulatory subunit 12A-like [Branchiostoma lanceolatum]|uniref:protein phosphatase 1 regulatory subunit 12A-like n=1 Tax=Branchiostoma lanceolatum TaxID=7740 RepID=UPI003451A546
MGHAARLEELTLQEAILQGLFGHVREMVEEGGVPVNRRDQEGRTPLICCALCLRHDLGIGMAKMLLEHGARAGPVDRAGRNALSYACSTGSEGLVDVLLGAADFDLNRKDRQGRTALFHAASKGRTDIVRKLVVRLLQYSQPINVRDMAGVSPLLEAAKNGHSVVIDVMIKVGNVEPTPKEETYLKTSKEEYNLVKVHRAQFLRHRNCFRDTVEKPTTPSRVQSAPSKARDAVGIRPGSSRPPSAMLHLRPKTAPNRIDLPTPSPSVSFDWRSIRPRTSWRTELQDLYKVLEVQISPSYRKSAVPPPKVPTPPPSESGDSESDALSDRGRRKGLSTGGTSARDSFKRRASLLGGTLGRAKRGSLPAVPTIELPEEKEEPSSVLQRFKKRGSMSVRTTILSAKLKDLEGKGTKDTTDTRAASNRRGSRELDASSSDDNRRPRSARSKRGSKDSDDDTKENRDRSDSFRLDPAKLAKPKRGSISVHTDNKSDSAPREKLTVTPPKLTLSPPKNDATNKRISAPALLRNNSNVDIDEKAAVQFGFTEATLKHLQTLADEALLHGDSVFSDTESYYNGTSTPRRLSTVTEIED